MPIRPENRHRYPPSWHEISRRIRFERAGSRCECEGECGVDHAKEAERCGIENFCGPPLNRCQAAHDLNHPVTRSMVVLTVAHLDHTPENCADDNLKAMCQGCHNRYDMPKRREGILQRARALLAIGDLFP